MSDRIDITATMYERLADAFSAAGAEQLIHAIEGSTLLLDSLMLCQADGAHWLQSDPVSAERARQAAADDAAIDRGQAAAELTAGTS